MNEAEGIRLGKNSYSRGSL